MNGNRPPTSLLPAVLALVFGLSLCFAQENSPNIAVYAYGANSNINKLLGSKLLSMLSQSGKYAEIADPGLFQNEIAASGREDIAYITQTAKSHGADYICVVSMTEAFGIYSVNARLIRFFDLQVLKTGLVDRALRSMGDLTAVSSELARQLLPPGSYVPSPPPSPGTPSVSSAAAAFAAASLAAPPAASAAAQGQCVKKYNINELLFKVKDKFPAKLKDCSGTLAKDMLTPASFGGHKLEPKSFMTQCTVDGVKNELPAGFPNKDKIIGSLTNFMQGLMNSASAGGAVDPKKLLSAVASMDIMGLVNDIKKLSDGECVVDEPYAPPAAAASNGDEKEGEEEESLVSFGIRAGANFSHIHADYKSGSSNYGDALGVQVGFVVDFEVSNRFHLQTGLMYVQKGMEDSNGEDITALYLEFPLLLSFKLSMLRLNAGPYFGLNIGNNELFSDGLDIGLSMGVGFDIGMLHIGTFYDYGFSNVSNKRGYELYNRTLGLNLGLNL